MNSSRADVKWENRRRHRRSTKPYKVTFKRNGVAIDITNWTIYFTLKSSMNDEDSEAIIDKKITTHSDPTNGESLITFTASETDIKGNYYYSVEYKDDEDNEGVIVYGQMEFEITVRKTRD